MQLIQRTTAWACCAMIKMQQICKNLPVLPAPTHNHPDSGHFGDVEDFFMLSFLMK